jgi:hypothetical protein
MTLTTSTTHADLTITASLDTETLRVSLDVDGIDAGSGRWHHGITDTSAQLVRDNADATSAVYDALDAGLRAQLAAQPAPAPAHDDCDDHSVRSLTCRACAAHVDVRDCDLCPECGKVPSRYYAAR